MNYKPRPWGIAYGIVSVALCTSITIAGCSWALSGAQKPEFPVSAVSAPVLAIPAAEPAISAADLWSDDRNRIDVPLVSAEVEAETQWAIFERCGQDTKLFCAVMAVAGTESDFDAEMVDDGGDSIGLMQINTRWHTDRMIALGVTDLTDPVQCAVVAIDYLLELEDTLGAGLDDHILYMSYNAGPASAKCAIQSGTSSTAYSESVLERYQEYMTEMEGMT